MGKGRKNTSCGVGKSRQEKDICGVGRRAGKRHLWGETEGRKIRVLQDKFLQCFSYKIFPDTHTVYRLMGGGGVSWDTWQ